MTLDPDMDAPEITEFPIEPTDPDKYTKAAQALVCSDYNEHHRWDSEVPSTPTDFYVTWFSKVLGNWKAMVSTDLESGLYWEVTYNGEKEEAYIDEYRKHHNTKTVGGILKRLFGRR